MPESAERPADLSERLAVLADLLEDVPGRDGATYAVGPTEHSSVRLVELPW